MVFPDPSLACVLAILELALAFELVLRFFILPRLQASTTKTKRPAVSQAGCRFISRFSVSLVDNRYGNYATAASVAASDRKISRPSLEPSRSSHARSGCGINPSTLRERLQMPAMLSRAPFEFAASVMFPF